jgi:hypothetical protein
MNVAQLRERLAGFPDEMLVLLDMEGDSGDLNDVIESPFLLDGKVVVLLIGPSEDEEPDYNDDFPMSLEYHDDDPRDDEVAREEAAMEREMMGE